MLQLLILSLITFLLSLLTTGWVKQRFRQNLLDIPNDRSSHSQPTPRGGGLGFIIAFASISILTPILSSYFPKIFPNNILQITASSQILNIWLILTPLAIIGIIDDQRNVPASIRYLVQLTAAGIALFCFGPFPQPWLTSFGLPGQIIAYTLTAIAITALINFYNFMDGLDGLVAGVTAVQLGFFALYLKQPVWWLLAAALLGFLWWNWSPAKIFMGDVGSTVLGAAVVIPMLNTDNPTQAWTAIAITLPLTAEAIYTLIRRLMRRENIFKAHRSHLYQRLQQSGWTHAQVASTYIGCTVLIALSILGWGAMGAGIGLALVVVGMVGGEVYLGRGAEERRSGGAGV
ncbi:MraY family glycosyltransferase [Planktothricoides raciborskii]|uniref:Glycosyltransferase family 4 protein n=1 Tax=Planktothricoides raciborskii FACHB-1370 TaxID=2949576 RepID=A0ABR8EH74_9CYAN|nr:glycosyltransferase family 4 protein [Planktothricoides raciborskii]MBD2544951.1 glycosyltransferase family 4 protein [Planktothricoides raciborskii FACHB-1370]MBD2584747.1 glycosyltransferase family 4 protein [Planktothricoides raciborskii FACHB-1261]